MVIRFKPDGTKVKVQEEDGKWYFVVKPSRGEAHKRKDQIVPGATMLGGIVPIPKKCDPQSMTFETSWTEDFSNYKEPNRKVQARGLRVHFKHMAAA